MYLFIMASTLIGSLSVFECTPESWTAYKECLGQSFIVNEIPSEEKVAALLTLLGDKKLMDCSEISHIHRNHLK